MAVLREVVSAPEMVNELDADEKADFLNAAGDVFCPDPEIRRRRTKVLQLRRRRETSRRDDDTLADTGIRSLRSRPVFTTPDVFAPEAFEQGDVADDPERPPFRETLEAQHCYICKVRYHEIHHFYDQLCRTCATLNFAKRSELADMSGMVVLLTGGRVKIGYQAGIKLLRSGAELIVATRFPRDAAQRYAAEADFADWGDRLEVFGLDLRHTPSVEAFCAHLLSTRTRLDAIINNACQTVRRPPGFYEHMMDDETAALGSLPPHVLQLVGSYEALRGGSTAITSAPGPAGAVQTSPSSDTSELAGLTRAAELSQAVLIPDDRPTTDTLFPAGQLDQDLQQVDLRGRNSWRLQLHEVSSVELLETQLVNAVAPFVLNARLKPLMEATPGDHKHIVNVSAVEGQFYRPRKTTKHPHTNMAKAALNMMTRTSATDYHASGINMNSVDTGWVSDEDPVDDRRGQDGRAPVPPAARHRRRCCSDRRPDHRRAEHGQPRLGPVPQGLRADRLVTPMLLALCARIDGNELIAAECARLTGGLPDGDGVAHCTSIEHIARAAYVKTGLRVVARADSFGALVDAVARVDFDADGFRIDVHDPSHRLGLTTQHVATALADVIAFAPDLKHPTHRFVVVATADGVALGEVMSVADSAYRAHDAKPWTTSSSLDARFSRALVNLVPSARSILDPCCGAGSIVLEAASLGLDAFGVDWKPAMVGMTRENLAAFDARAVVQQADSRTHVQAADAIVTDLPYGNAIESDEAAVRAILEQGATLAPVAVYVASTEISEWLAAAGYDDIAVHSVVKRRGFTRFVHVARSRRVNA